MKGGIFGCLHWGKAGRSRKRREADPEKSQRNNRKEVPEGSVR